MKNLKNLFALLPLLLLLATFSSCKKDADESSPDNLDMTQFYIAGKYTGTYNGSNVSLPYILTFDALAQVSVTNGISTTSHGNYVYDNGTLTITWNANAKDVFKISNGAVTSYQGNSGLTSYQMQKIPASNMLAGNTYNGSLSTPGSNVFLLTKLKFSDSKYGEGSIGDPTVNKDYTLIKNIAATSNTGANGTLSFFILINGKLEVSRFTPTNANGSGTLSYGTLQ